MHIQPFVTWEYYTLRALISQDLVLFLLWFLFWNVFLFFFFIYYLLLLNMALVCRIDTRIIGNSGRIYVIYHQSFIQQMKKGILLYHHWVSTEWKNEQNKRWLQILKPQWVFCYKKVPFTILCQFVCLLAISPIYERTVELKCTQYDQITENNNSQVVT